MYWRVSSICSTRIRVRWCENWNWKLAKRSTRTITWVRRRWKFYWVSAMSGYLFVLSIQFSHIIHSTCCRTRAVDEWKLTQQTKLFYFFHKIEEKKESTFVIKLFCFEHNYGFVAKHHAHQKVSSNYACATFECIFFSTQTFSARTFYCDAWFIFCSLFFFVCSN